MKDNSAPLNSLSNKSFSELDGYLNELGMAVLGGFYLRPEEAAQFTRSSGAVAGLVVSSHGRSMWQVFQKSSFYADQLPNPLDRWTKSVLEKLSLKTRTELALPFDRPFPPIQEWTKRATGISNSPLGILMHPRYGLWFGLRGVFFFKVNVENQDVNKLIHRQFNDNKPCDLCVEKPCLSGCPVSAFDESGLNVNTCFSHLAKTISSSFEPDCLSNGCAAREACPVGNEYRYCSEQMHFHMKSYYSS